MAKIKSISYYLPDNVVTNEELSQRFPEWSIEKIAQKTGITERRIAKKDEYASDLAANAAELLFYDYNIKRTDIDFLLYCTQSPDYFLPTTACIIQERLKLSTTIGALDYNLGCSGYVYGLGIAKGLIDGGIAKNVLLLTGETYSKYIHPMDKGNLTLFGDAGSASLITQDEGMDIKKFVFGTDGGGAQSLIVRNGGGVNLHIKGENFFDDNGFVKNDDNLYMDGGEVFKFTVNEIPKLINDILEKHELGLDDINYFIFHQANKYMLNTIRKKIGIPEEKFLLHMQNSGNTVSATIPIVLDEYIKQNKFRPGDKILLAGFGVGLSWGGTILEY